MSRLRGSLLLLGYRVQLWKNTREYTRTGEKYYNLLSKSITCRTWWRMCVIPAAPETEEGGQPGSKIARPV